MLLRLSNKIFPFSLKLKRCFVVKPRPSTLYPGRKQNRYEEIEKSLKDFFNAKEEDPDHDLDLSEIRNIKESLVSELEDENMSENEGNIDPNSSLKRGLHHLFMVNVDPEIASLDLQTFVMKASEKLSPKGLRDFLSTLNVLKTKTATNSIKNKNKKEESVFIHKCFKIFDTEQVPELNDLLLKCDVSRLTHQNFTSTISCIEEEIDLQNKITKFSDFNNHQIPPERPLLNEFVKPTSDSELLEKLAKINGRGKEEKRSGKVSLMNDLDGLDSKEDQEVQGSKNTEKMIFEMLSQEVENSLNNGFEEEKEKIDFQKEATEFNASNNWQSRNIARLTRILQETTKEKVDLKLQKPNEILTLSQYSFYSRDPPTPSTFVYIYRLPYKIDDIPTYENSLKEKLERFFGKVKSIKIFQYKDFLDIAPKERRVITLRKNLNEIWNEQDLEAGKEAKSNKTMGGETVGEIIKKLKLDDEEAEVDETKDDARSKYAKRSGARTDKILTSITDKHSSKLDKSYALVEFDSMEGKTKALIPELRVFGFKLGNNMLAMDDADHKITLVCNNVHWGASFKRFKNALNNTLMNDNGLDLKLEIDPDDEDKIITKYFLLLRFNSLHDSLRALKILRKTVYEKRELKFSHLFGPLKRYKNNYCEVIDGDPNQDLLTKIRNKRIQEMNREIGKFSGVKTDEEGGAFKPVINDLLLEEGVKKMANEEEEMPPIYLHNIEEDE